MKHEQATDRSTSTNNDAQRLARDMAPMDRAWESDRARSSRSEVN